MKPAFKPCSVLAPFFLVAAVAGCSPTPVEPTAGVNQAGGLTAAAPTPTPTPDDPRCRCTNIDVTFEPGGAAPTWGLYVLKKAEVIRVGFRLNVTCDGKGQSNLCEVYQNEDGSLTWTLGKREGKLVGKSKKVNSFPVANTGDPWHKEYSDALGADYPLTSTEKMHIELNMTFELKCVSSDKVAANGKSKKFKLEGSVDAQASGGQLTLTNPKLTLTPL